MELLITEIFHSLQGETSHSGIPYTFVRLTGCNLRCTYCDTAYAFHGGKKMTVDEVVTAVETFGCRNVLITGGEPVLQRSTGELCRVLASKDFRISIETHGEASLEAVAPWARVIMDVKTPSSGMCQGKFKRNIDFLKDGDEVKFVIASREDYRWAKETLQEFPRLESFTVLFSPAVQAKGQPGEFPGVEPKWLAERILEDRLDVRFQLQLHKLIGLP